MIEDSYFIAENKYGKYCIPKSSAYTYTSKAILDKKVHEEETILFLRENHKGKTIIHAGAGFGDFFPALKNEKITIWSFEPNEENFSAAQKTIELNSIKNVVLFNIGLGTESSYKRIMTKENEIALGARSYISDEGNQKIQIIALDEIIPESTEISIIHLDTEGFEFEILNGAKKIIEKYKPLIILEIDEKPLKYNEKMKEIGYYPKKQLIYDAKDMVFVNTVYEYKRGK